MNIIELKNVKKEYKKGSSVTNALNNVSFKINEGEFLVILGPSGSGKSTILNIIGGIDVPTDGEMRYKKDKLDFKNKKRLLSYRKNVVGFVFQFYNLLPTLNVKENIEFASELVNSPFSTDELLEQIGLADKANFFPSQLSGGQQQRVAIARALAKNPDILLCDEPTGALDTKTGAEMLKLISKFNKKYKKTVILITHNEMISAMADRVLKLKDGKIEKVITNKKKLSVEEIDW
jgi:putative ABC transport system ATP-binding protein